MRATSTRFTDISQQVSDRRTRTGTPPSSSRCLWCRGTL
uniref:Uncharacterized protein n=1 Tax=Parascaris equorum TaxID=6256 RepID=A0A914RFU3_PAREQ